eukprot:763881-Hanusia_phi.AAC.2
MARDGIRVGKQTCDLRTHRASMKGRSDLTAAPKPSPRPPAGLPSESRTVPSRRSHGVSE